MQRPAKLWVSSSDQAPKQSASTAELAVAADLRRAIAGAWRHIGSVISGPLGPQCLARAVTRQACPTPADDCGSALIWRGVSRLEFCPNDALVQLWFEHLQIKRNDLFGSYAF